MWNLETIVLLACKTFRNTHAVIHVKTHRPGQVPSRDKQTLPLLYKFGLNLTLPPPVVRKCSRGGLWGYSRGIRQSNSNKPPAYGVSSGPAIIIFLESLSARGFNHNDYNVTYIASCRTSSTLTQTPGGRHVLSPASSLMRCNLSLGFLVQESVCRS